MTVLLGSPPQRRRPRPWPTPLIAAGLMLVFSGSASALPGIQGLFLVGGSVNDHDPPMLVFGADGATATAETLGDMGLQVVSQGITEMAIDGEATRVGDVFTEGLVEAEAVLVNGVPQFELWDLDTFDSPLSGQWTENYRSVCAAPSDLFLGGHCKFGSTTTSRVYVGLPTHRKVRIQARLHFFDNWNGEAVAIQADNSTVWAHAHSWCPGFLNDICLKFGVDSCGQDTPDTLSVKAQVTISHNSPTLKLAFGSNLPIGSDACLASWGVDDVSVELA